MIPLRGSLFSEPSAFDFDQLSDLTRVLGFEIVTDWEVVLDDLPFAVVNRFTPLHSAGSAAGSVE